MSRWASRLQGLPFSNSDSGSVMAEQKGALRSELGSNPSSAIPTVRPWVCYLTLSSLGILIHK